MILINKTAVIGGEEVRMKAKKKTYLKPIIYAIGVFRDDVIVTSNGLYNARDNIGSDQLWELD